MRIVKIPSLDLLEPITNSPYGISNEYFDRSTSERYVRVQGELNLVYVKDIFSPLVFVLEGTDLDEIDKKLMLL